MQTDRRATDPELLPPSLACQSSGGDSEVSCTVCQLLYKTTHIAHQLMHCKLQSFQMLCVIRCSCSRRGGAGEGRRGGGRREKGRGVPHSPDFSCRSVSFSPLSSTFEMLSFMIPITPCTCCCTLPGYRGHTLTLNLLPMFLSQAK